MDYLKNQKKNYKKLNERLTAYIAQLHKIYEIYNKEASSIALRTNYTADDDFEFKFSDFPETKYAVERLQRNFSNSLSALVYSGISKEWKNSNEAQDLMANEILKKFNARVNGEKYKIIYQTNSDALKAFLERKDKGFGISDKIWNQSGNYIKSLEAAISTAISKGTSAVTLSKQISKYLIDFKKLQKDYKSKFGQATDIHDCEYRSARLARSEINMAYRTAEQTRWNQMDFVLGYEIELSNSHPKHDICDTLSGSYPKDFKWTGWHPNDLCHCVPILMSESDFIKWNNGEPVEPKEITDVPEAFKQWVRDNSDKIAEAQSKGTLPYFVKDNMEYVETSLQLSKSTQNISTRFSEDAFTQERKNNAVWAQSADESMQKLYYGKAEKILDNLSKEESSAYYEYSSGSGFINRPLRGFEGNWKNFKGIGNVPLDFERANTTKIIDDLTNAISKSTFDTDVWLERGVRERGLFAFLGIKDISELSPSIVGKVVKDTGFMSCSAAKGTSFGGYILNIYCPKGTKMLYIDGRSYFSQENEMLLQRGTSFRIIKVDGKFIDIEVIKQDF